MLKVYRVPYGREMRMLRVVRVGDWFHWVPSGGKPRVIVKAFGRRYIAAMEPLSDKRRLQRLATGWTLNLGRIHFTTMANR